MSNILNNNRHNLKLKLNNDEYWDFHLDKDSYVGSYKIPNTMYDKCLISYVDFSNPSSYSGENKSEIYSSDEYSWVSGISKDNTLYNVGYTAVDNGRITYDKCHISNKEFMDIYSGSTEHFNEGDLRLHLIRVSGNTEVYSYDIDNSGDLPKFKGGFYQGVFKTSCGKYQILPTKINGSWDFEFTIKREQYDDLKDSTINKKFGNDGIFFYIGTRASNKWAELYNSDDMMSAVTDPYLINGFSSITWSTQPLGRCCKTSNEGTIGLVTDEDSYIDLETPFNLVGMTEETIDLIDYLHDTEDCGEGEFIYKQYDDPKADCLIVTIDCELPMYNGDYAENDATIEDFMFTTNDYGIKLSDNKQYTKIVTDNKFLLFHRACDGYNVSNWVEDESPLVEYVIPKNGFNGNLFLYMNRTCTGYTVDTIDKLKEEYREKYDIYADLYNNALAFIITENGSIGYKYYTKDCSISGDDKTYIKEGYSFDGVIEKDKWYSIHVKVLKRNENMQLMFYVNGKLKYVTDEMPMIDLRKLNEDDEKQELVPFNISIGGGTQGLCDVVYYNFMKTYDIEHALEKEFCGSFNGQILNFRWFNCEAESINILQNYLYDLNTLSVKNYL